MRKLLSVLLLLISMPLIAQTCKISITASTPDSRFVVNGQEVIDTVTGLVWQKCSLGQSDSTCSGTAQTYTWAAALQTAETQSQQTGQNWRLPDLKELRSIVEEKCNDPAINSSIFPNTIPLEYWSASPYPNYIYGAWNVDFGSGGSIETIKEFIKYVRLVRTGQ